MLFSKKTLFLQTHFKMKWENLTDLSRQVLWMMKMKRITIHLLIKLEDIDKLEIGNACMSPYKVVLMITPLYFTTFYAASCYLSHTKYLEAEL